MRFVLVAMVLGAAVFCTVRGFLRCTRAEVERYAAFNSGLWHNTLLLGPKDQAIIESVQTARRVVKGAYELLTRG